MHDAETKPERRQAVRVVYCGYSAVGVGRTLLSITACGRSLLSSFRMLTPQNTGLCSAFWNVEKLLTRPTRLERSGERRRYPSMVSQKSESVPNGTAETSVNRPKRPDAPRRLRLSGMSAIQHRRDISAASRLRLVPPIARGFVAECETERDMGAERAIACSCQRRARQASDNSSGPGLSAAFGFAHAIHGWLRLAGRCGQRPVA